ncbi:MAG TPA: YdcF family protein [Blastocatellia bacterium]|nr:YdcF family protein [Blastocatellia bacterium]
MDLDLDRLARKIWDYHHLNHRLERSEIILALGSSDLRVAEYAADLYLQGWAPRLICSGHLGNFTKERFTKSEAELFAEIARDRGVPPEAILIEAESTNSGQNVIYSRRLLERQGLDPESFILVQKPYMERRAYATFMNFWPGKRVIAASPPISFDDYPTPELPKDLVINIMVGDLQRIKVYPDQGFQIEQEIPAEVWEAFEQLVAAGYTQHLIKN